MFVPAPIDEDYVVYTKLRAVAGKTGRSTSSAMLQRGNGLFCADKPDCRVSCDPGRVCVLGSCEPIGSPTYNRVCGIG